MRVERVTESNPTVIELSEEQAAELRRVGQRLASDKAWWGGGSPNSERTVIQCQALGDRKWAVRIQDAVGLVSVGDLQIVVEPKIPVRHLLYLFGQAAYLPRLDDQAGAASTESSLWELVARWFVRATNEVLRRELVKDYTGVEESLRMVRGRIVPLPTARAIYVGRPDIHCQFDEFSWDSPLNRLLKAAARGVRRSALLGREVRRDAARILARLVEVGELRTSDLYCIPERRTAHYADAVVLAKHIVRSVGRSLDSGDASAWTFLIRTPEVVEEGLRLCLARTLGPAAVFKRGRQLPGTAMTVNPDLVFPARAVGDIKYKRWEGTWHRGDLYEVVAFATAFKVRNAMLVDFGEDEPAGRNVSFGDVTVRRFSWPCGTFEPVKAEGVLVEAVRVWHQALAKGSGRAA